MQQKHIKNRILSGLSKGAFAAVEPFLEPRVCAAGEVLHSPGRKVESVYFPDKGVVGVICQGARRSVTIEIVGREGFVDDGILECENSHICIVDRPALKRLAKGYYREPQLA